MAWGNDPEAGGGWGKDPPSNPNAKKSSAWDQIGAFAASATEQIPFLDEAAAGVVALTSGKPYAKVRQVQKEMATEDRQSRPLARNAGGVAGFGATLFTPGARYIGEAKTFGQASLRAAQVGAAYGAAQGAATAPDGLQNRFAGAARGAAVGAVVGGATPAAVRTAAAIPALGRRAGAAAAATGQAVAQKFGAEAPEAVVTPKAQQRAIEYVADLARKAKVTPEQLANHPSIAAGEPITSAEALGRTGVGQAMALARRTGTTGDVAEGLLATRAEDAPKRLLGHMADTAGINPEGAQGGIDAIVEAGRARAKPLFDAALSTPGPIWNPELESLSRRPVIKRAISNVAEDILNEGKDPSALGLVKRVERVPGGGSRDVYDQLKAPTAQTWDAVKKAIARQVERHPITNRPLPDSVSQGNFGVNSAERALTAALRKHIPGYAEALNSSGDYMSVAGAFQRAQGSLFSTKTTPAQFEKMWSSWKSDAEANAARHALAAEIFNKAQNGQLRPGRLLVPAVRQKLAAAFGQDAAEQLIQRVKIQAKNAVTGNRIRPYVNSTTAETMLAGAEQDNGLESGALKAGGHLFAGRPVRAAGSVINAFVTPIRGAITPIDQATRDEVGRLLMLPPDELSQLLRAAPKTETRFAVSGLAAAPAAKLAATSR